MWNVIPFQRWYWHKFELILTKYLLIQLWLIKGHSPNPLNFKWGNKDSMACGWTAAMIRSRLFMTINFKKGSVWFQCPLPFLRCSQFQYILYTSVLNWLMTSIWVLIRLLGSNFRLNHCTFLYHKAEKNLRLLQD